MADSKAQQARKDDLFVNNDGGNVKRQREQYAVDLRK